MQAPKSLTTLEQETKTALRRIQEDKQKKIAAAQAALDNYVTANLRHEPEFLEGDSIIQSVIYELTDIARRLKIDVESLDLPDDNDHDSWGCDDVTYSIYNSLIAEIEEKKRRLTRAKINKIKDEADAKEAEIKAEATKEFLLLLLKM